MYINLCFYGVGICVFTPQIKTLGLFFMKLLMSYEMFVSCVVQFSAIGAQFHKTLNKVSADRVMTVGGSLENNFSPSKPR